MATIACLPGGVVLESSFYEKPSLMEKIGKNYLKFFLSVMRKKGKQVLADYKMSRELCPMPTENAPEMVFFEG